MKASEVTIQWLKERLEGWEGSSGSYAAWCPCHDDIGSSHKGLSITLSGKRVLAKCHSPQCGASLTRVIEVLEGSPAQEQPTVRVKKRERPRVSRPSGLDWWEQKTQIPAKFWYSLGVEDFEHGIAFTFTGEETVKVRKPEKEIMWIPGHAETFPLWPYPEDPMPEHILITEGESDCGTARYAELPLAYAVTKGSSTPLDIGAFEVLLARGVKEVTICADADDAGRELNSRLTRSAVEAGLAVNTIDLSYVIDPFSGIKDLNGVWKAATDKAHFLELIERCTRQVQYKYPTFSYQDLLAISEQETDWVLSDLIAPGDKVLLSGPMKAYKTWIMLDLARALVTGKPFLQRGEWRAKRPRRVLVVEEEGSRDAFSKRIKRMGLTVKEGARIVFLHREGIRFTEPDTIAFLIDLCRSAEIDVLFLDPLQRMIPGIDENNSAETGVVWDEVFRLQHTCPGLVVCIAHHANKTERLTWESVRGSSRHGGEVDVGIFVEKHPTEEHTVRIAIDGRDVFAQLGPGEAFEGRVSIQDDSFAIDATEISIRTSKKAAPEEGYRTEIMLALKNGCETRTQIMRETNYADLTVRKYLNQFIEEGLIERGEKEPGKPIIYRWKEDEDG